MNKQVSLKVIPLGPEMTGWNLSRGNHRGAHSWLHDITHRNQREQDSKLCRKKNPWFCLSAYRSAVCFLNDEKREKKRKIEKKKLWKIWSWYFALLGKSFCIYQSWQGNKMPEILSVCCAWRQIIAEAIVPHAANKNTVVHKLKSYEKRRVQQLTSILLLLSFVCTSWPYWRAYQELVLHRHHVYCQGISTKWQITAFGVQGAEK